jgi:hypothetical protein
LLGAVTDVTYNQLLSFKGVSMRALILLTVLMISTSGFAQRVKENVKQQSYVKSAPSTQTKTKSQSRDRFDFSEKSKKKSKD